MDKYCKLSPRRTAFAANRDSDRCVAIVSSYDVGTDCRLDRTA
jgi:hypothetical protein